MENPLGQAIRLLLSGDREIYFIAFTSLRISLTSTAIASLLSVPVGILLHFKHFPLKRVLISILNSLMALPTVVVGLLVFSFISRSGPLGSLNLLYSPPAIIIGQIILISPILISLVYSGFSKIDARFHETVITLGAKPMDVLKAAVVEARFVIASAVLAGFGRLIGEIGVSMMLGGNIRWYTRTMTTAIALETSKGEFIMGLALGFILVALAFVINGIIHWLIRNE